MRLVQALEKLHEARRYVQQGERDIRAQRMFVRRLERRGCDAGRAKEQLQEIEKMQDKYLELEDRVSSQVMGILQDR